MQVGTKIHARSGAQQGRGRRRNKEEQLLQVIITQDNTRKGAGQKACDVNAQPEIELELEGERGSVYGRGREGKIQA